MFRKIIIISLLIFCSGCATLYNPATGRNEFIIIDTQKEVAIGENVSTEVTKEHAVSENQELQDRVKSIGANLAAVSDRNDLEYHFTVLEEEDLNAMALPGGYIYVFRGLAEALNDDELAYVLAHEVGHVAARHIVKKIQANMGYQLLMTVALSSVGDKTGQTAQNVAQGVNTVYNLIGLSYSRKDEYEADRLGVKYAYKAGFDPYGSISALEAIKKKEGPNWKLLAYFRTHPYVDDRIKALKDIIPQVAGKTIPSNN